MKAWERFLAQLPEELIHPWLAAFKVQRFDAANLYLETPTPLHNAWFDEHIRHRLRSFTNENGRPIKVHLIAPSPSPTPSSPAPPPIEPSPLDPTFTFAHFLPSNPMAIETLTTLSFNPIFLFGPKGSGKTHLLHATTHALIAQGLRPFFVRAERFTEHVVQAIRQGFMQQFRATYRAVDALIIDDIHLLARKNATQEEFFHTFNTLHSLGKPLLFSAPTPPSHLSDIEARLISRFEWGIALPLTPHPIAELLTYKANLWNFPTDTHLILEHFPNDPLLALHTLLIRTRGKPPPPSDILPRLKDLQRPIPTPERILHLVAAHFSLTPSDLTGKSQTRDISFPRKAAMYLCRALLNLPYQRIGDLFHRDHSTVIASIAHIKSAIATKDPTILELLNKDYGN